MDNDGGQAEGEGGTSKVDERIYALLAMVEDQQTAVRAGDPSPSTRRVPACRPDLATFHSSLGFRMPLPPSLT